MARYRKSYSYYSQAGIYYKKKKNEKFMQNYKTRYTELHQAEDPDIYILDNAKRIFPNKDKYIEIKNNIRNGINIKMNQKFFKLY